MIVIVIVLVLIIVGGIGLLLKIKLNNKKAAIESKQNKQAIMEQIRATKVPSSKPEEEQIEVLELYPEDSLKKVEVSEDTLDLNDLFKTISMKAIEDNQKFDFGLQRSEEK